MKHVNAVQVIGWAAGKTRVPGVFTWSGGAVMIGALIYNTYAESKRAASRQKRAAVNQATSEALNDTETVEMTAFTIADEEDVEQFYVDES